MIGASFILLGQQKCAARRIDRVATVQYVCKRVHGRESNKKRSWSKVNDIKNNVGKYRHIVKLKGVSVWVND